MDFSKLNSNERLAAWGAIASIIGGVLVFFGSYGAGGGLLLTLILGIAMLAVVFLPQWSPATTLPGSKGSLMLVIGGIAAIGALLGLLAFLSFLGLLAAYAGFFLIPLLALLLSIVGGVMMGLGGWREFQAEGGKFQLGTAGTAPAAPPAPAAPSAPAAPPAPPAAPSEPMAPPSATDTMGSPSSPDVDDSMPR